MQDDLKLRLQHPLVFCMPDLVFLKSRIRFHLPDPFPDILQGLPVVFLQPVKNLLFMIQQFPLYFLLPPVHLTTP